MTDRPRHCTQARTNCQRIFGVLGIKAELGEHADDRTKLLAVLGRDPG